MRGSEQDIRNLKTQIAVTETTFERLQLLDDVEAAVRADHIEKDAGIAEGNRPWNYDRPDDWTENARGSAQTADHIAAAIRAQLGEGNGERDD